jgi:hypothetical protein
MTQMSQFAMVGTTPESAFAHLTNLAAKFVMPGLVPGIHVFNTTSFTPPYATLRQRTTVF